MSQFTLSFQEIHQDDIAKVGGKGANLGAMTRAGFPVPTGFCITTRAYKAFIAQADRDIYQELDTIDTTNLTSLKIAGKQLRDYLQTLVLPKDVSDSIVATWQTLGIDKAYAVRSSATAEDLPSSSFAGQQDTYLNIRGQQQLLAKVKSCMISLFTDRAILYRMQNNFAHEAVALSVVVQQMVQPDVAGIMFTADPITGHRDVLSIDASFGLGEALVSGLVSADLYKVNKRTHHILTKQIAAKKIAITSLTEGGTKQVELTKQQQKQTALSEPKILALAQLGAKIESHFGRPQDIEWALVGAEFFITQSRPITALYPLPEPPPKHDDNSLHIYFSLSHLQVMTDPMPPLSISVLACILPLGHKNGALENHYIKSAGGRFYADLSCLLRHPIGRKLLLKGWLPKMDPMAGGAITPLTSRPDFLAQGIKFNPLKMLPLFLPSILKAFSWLLWRSSKGVPQQTSLTIKRYLLGVDKRLAHVQTSEQKFILALKEMRSIIDPVASWVPALLAGVIASDLLKSVFFNEQDRALLSRLERGQQGNVVTQMNLALGDLADFIRPMAKLHACLTDTTIDSMTRLKQAQNCQGGSAFLKAWHSFIDQYGARTTSEIDLSLPRWSEDPTTLLQMVLNTVEHNPQSSHKAHHQKLIAEADKAEQVLIKKAAKGWLGCLRRPLAKRLIQVSRNLMPLREHHKFLVMQLVQRLKPIFNEVGTQLHQQGQLELPSDIWFLRLPEIKAALENSPSDIKQGAHLKHLAIERRVAQPHYKKLTPPHVITSEGEIPAFSFDIDAPEGALIGNPVSAGIIEGIAKVILDPATETLKTGEILVAPFTDPGWTPLFVNAKGLVTEVGGLMTHGSVVAREYGIPAVVGVVDATKTIKTGQKLRINGTAGIVEILEQSPPPTVQSR